MNNIWTKCSDLYRVIKAYASGRPSGRRVSSRIEWSAGHGVGVSSFQPETVERVSSRVYPTLPCGVDGVVKGFRQPCFHYRHGVTGLVKKQVSVCTNGVLLEFFTSFLPFPGSWYRPYRIRFTFPIYLFAVFVQLSLRLSSHGEVQTIIHGLLSCFVKGPVSLPL